MVIGFRGEPELIQSRSFPLIKHKETPEIHPHLASAIFPVKSGQSTMEMWYSRGIRRIPRQTFAPASNSNAPQFMEKGKFTFMVCIGGGI